MLRTITSYARISRLSNVHPAEKLVLSIIPLIAAGYSTKPALCLINILVFSLLHALFNNPLKVVSKFVLGIAGFMMLSSITLVADYGIGYCLLLLLKGISGGIAVSFLTLTTPLDDLLYTASRVGFLRDICDIAKSMERFLMLLEDELSVLHKAVQSRGGFDTFSLKLRNTSRIAGMLFVNTMKRWTEIRNGINSRCYRGYMPYIHREFQFSLLRFSLICLYCTALIIIIIV